MMPPPGVPPPNFSVPPPGYQPPSNNANAADSGQELWVENKAADGKVYNSFFFLYICKLKLPLYLSFSCL